MIKEKQKIPIIRIYQKQVDDIQADSMYVRSPEDGFMAVKSMISDLDREAFVVLCLSTKNRINHIEVAHIGSINQALIHPREIFKSAILSNSAAIIIAHNHPSGELNPSPEDISITERLKSAGELMGIELMDHLIIAGDSHLSLKEFNYL